MASARDRAVADERIRGEEGAGDAALLAAVPDILCLDVMLKATPREEGGARIVYIQASDESVDAQGERVLCKALQDSADTFLRYGNVDIDHLVLLGPKSGLPNYMEYEIGRPVEVGFRDDKTFVKAELYQGSGPLARNANMVWESLTALQPPARWYPSVGGGALAKSIEVDPVTKARVPVIKSVRWTNLALSRTPVNQSVPSATTVPLGTFAKSLGGYALKALVAGHGTDMAALDGGAALRTQSLDPEIQSYWDFSERLAADLRKGACEPREAAMSAHAARAYGLRADKAVAWTTRFLADLHDALQTGPHA
jgi:hypothetical protein